MNGPLAGPDARLRDVDTTSARLRDLESAVVRLSARIDSLERDTRASFDTAPTHVSPIADITIPGLPSGLSAAGVARVQSPGWLGLVGRTFIVLGGAFLLRALTESGQLPAAGGVWLGLAYAAVWMALAARVTGPSSFFHGIASLLVGLPLILEAALKFRAFSAATSAAVLAAIAVAALAVAWRSRQRAFAMMASLGALATAFALAFGTGTMLPCVLALLAIGTAALWVSYARDWDWLPWPPAAAANLAVLFLAIRASHTPPRDGPLVAQAAHALLILAYVGSFVIRVLLHEREVRLFEVAQTAAALAIGLAGATVISHTQGLGVTAIAIPSMLAAGVLYVQTFARVAPRRGFGPEFYYVSMTALALALVGISLIFPYPARPIAVASGALLASLGAWRFGHPMLALQGAIAAVVASAESGLVTFTATVWLTHTQLWPHVGDADLDRAGRGAGRPLHPARDAQGRVTRARVHRAAGAVDRPRRGCRQPHRHRPGPDRARRRAGSGSPGDDEDGDSRGRGGGSRDGRPFSPSCGIRMAGVRRARCGRCEDSVRGLPDVASVHALPRARGLRSSADLRAADFEGELIGSRQALPPSVHPAG